MKATYNELYEKLSRLQWLLHRSHQQSRMGDGPFADPSRGQGRVLAMLKLQPEISSKDLSYLLGIRQQSLNELLNKLEKSGHITRVPSEEDRRVMLVRLTDKGLEEEQASADRSDIFSCLNADEQEAFGSYLDRIIAAMESQMGPDEDMEDWMAAARTRMGDEQFQQLMSMRRGPHHGRCPEGHGPEGHGPGKHRHGHHGAPGQGHGGHGPGCPHGQDGPCGRQAADGSGKHKRHHAPGEQCPDKQPPHEEAQETGQE